MLRVSSALVNPGPFECVAEGILVLVDALPSRSLRIDEEEDPPPSKALSPLLWWTMVVVSITCRSAMQLSYLLIDDSIDSLRK